MQNKIQSLDSILKVVQKSSLKLSLHIDLHWIRFFGNILKNGGIISMGAESLPPVAVIQSYIGLAVNGVGNGAGRRRRKKPFGVL